MVKCPDENSPVFYDLEKVKSGCGYVVQWCGCNKILRVGEYSIGK